MDISAIIGASCFVLAFIANIAALGYGYGTLNNRVRNCESDYRMTDASTRELFTRMNAIEQLAARLEDAALRWEKIMSNGINTKIADISERIARLEQHCKDMHLDTEFEAGYNYRSETTARKGKS
jgi:hypothetical protein